MTSVFDELEQNLESGGVAACLTRLVDYLTEQKLHQELFEARKMQVRHELGLPLLTNDLPDDLEDDQRREIEDQLIDKFRVVYRDVGQLMFEDGQLNQGWLLLQAAGEESFAQRQLNEMEVDQDNLDEFVEVALNQGVATARGFAAVLEHYGTCNAITTFDQVLHGRPLAERQTAAKLLIDHLRDELLANVKSDIANQQGTEPTEETLAELVADRDWLFNDGAYHVDTTHLSSTVRFARLVTDEDALRKAIDLTEYGRRLQTTFQYEGEEPFKDVYPSHALYFRALLGEDVDEAVEFFKSKAEAAQVESEGTAAVEVYIDLLARVGRQSQAAQATVALIPPGIYTQGLAPTLFELCEQDGDFSTLINACRDREDILGFAAGLIRSQG